METAIPPLRKYIFAATLGVCLMADVARPVDYAALKKEINDTHWAISKTVGEQKLSKEAIAQIVEKSLGPIRVRHRNASGEALEAFKVAEMLMTTPFVRDIPLRTRVLKEVPPTSPAWKLATDLLRFFPMLCDGDVSALYAKELEKHGVPEVRIAFQEVRILECLEEEKLTEARALLAKLEGDFPKCTEAQRLAKYIAEIQTTAIGSMAPDFVIQDLDNPANSLTLASFKGKFVMLDFWATWCSWCVAELPFTHAAYGKFKDRGFEILSVSADDKPGEVQAFRKEQTKGPMPWKHAWCGKAGEMNKIYRVDGWPTLFLIGPDGRILAKGEALRGDKLEKTLTRFMDAR